LAIQAANTAMCAEPDHVPVARSVTARLTTQFAMLMDTLLSFGVDAFPAHQLL